MTFSLGIELTIGDLILLKSIGSEMFFASSDVNILRISYSLVA